MLNGRSVGSKRLRTYYMFKRKGIMDIVVQHELRIRRHDAVVYETCRQNLDKYKKRCHT